MHRLLLSLLRGLVLGTHGNLESERRGDAHLRSRAEWFDFRIFDKKVGLNSETKQKRAPWGYWLLRDASPGHGKEEAEIFEEASVAGREQCIEQAATEGGLGGTAGSGVPALADFPLVLP